MTIYSHGKKELDYVDHICKIIVKLEIKFKKGIFKSCVNDP